MKDFFNKIFRVWYSHQGPQEIKHEYKLPETINFTLRMTPDGWFVVTMPDHPGLITEAKNSKELFEMINDAVLTYYNVPKHNLSIIYDSLNIGGTVLNYYDFSKHKTDGVFNFLSIGDTVTQYQGQLQTQHA